MINRGVVAEQNPLQQGIPDPADVWYDDDCNAHRFVILVRDGQGNIFGYYEPGIPDDTRSQTGAPPSETWVLVWLRAGSQNRDLPAGCL